MVQPDSPRMIIWRMRIACWITNTHSQYVILISFPLQQWSQERASILRYTYIGCLVLSTTSQVFFYFVFQVFNVLNNIDNQLDATVKVINNSNQLNMFRAIISPIFGSTGMCVTACGIMHPRCYRYAGSL